MGCYTCKLHENAEKLRGNNADQLIEVSGQKRDIDALLKFLSGPQNKTPYSVEEHHDKFSDATLVLRAPKELEGGEPFTMGMINTHLNQIGEELQLLANQQVLPADTSSFGKKPTLY